MAEAVGAVPYRRMRSDSGLVNAQTRPQRLDALAAAVMVLLCAIWGVQQVASKVALAEGIPPILQALVRSMAAGPLVVAWLGLRRGRRGLATLFASDGTLAAGSLAAVMFAFEFILLFEGIKRTSASRSVVILYAAAFFTAIGAHLLIPGERLRRVNALGLLLAFAGAAATIGGGSGESSLLGNVLVLGAAATWGLTTVVVKRSAALMAAPPEKVLAYQLLGSIPFLLLAAALGGQLILPHATAAAWWSLAFQCIVVAFASYLTWFWLISRYPAGRLAAFSFLTPLFGVASAAALLDEKLTPMLLVGLVCVGVGLRLVNR